MNVVFVDDGKSNRGLMAMSISNYMFSKKKSGNDGGVNFLVAATGKAKNMHKKAVKAIEEFGSDLEIYSKKIINDIDDMVQTEKTIYIVLGQDNKKKKVREIVRNQQDSSMEVWAVENPLTECDNEVKLRFYRRTRDQLWVKIEELLQELDIAITK